MPYVRDIGSMRIWCHHGAAMSMDRESGGLLEWRITPDKEVARRLAPWGARAAGMSAGAGWYPMYEAAAGGAAWIARTRYQIPPWRLDASHTP